MTSKTIAIEESARHEGTWLIWPHEYHFEKKKVDGKPFLDAIEGIWIEIVQALSEGEKVRIIAYFKNEIKRIKKLLKNEGVDISDDAFVVAESNSFWVRDTGPIFAEDTDGKPVILNFAFDSWGKTPDDDGEVLYELDNKIPAEVAKCVEVPNYVEVPIIDIPDFVLEGGAFEYDGKGTLMVCKSSVASTNRNPEWEIEQAEAFLKRYLANNIIWLEGRIYGKYYKDITDCHIDGIARFYDSNTIISLPETFFPPGDFDRLSQAKNAAGKPYDIIPLPITKDNDWVYINYYIGNDVIILPMPGKYANVDVVKTIKSLYPNKRVVKIDVTALVKHGGAIHCITQQQPKYPVSSAL